MTSLNSDSDRISLPSDFTIREEIPKIRTFVPGETITSIFGEKIIVPGNDAKFLGGVSKVKNKWRVKIELTGTKYVDFSLCFQK